MVCQNSTINNVPSLSSSSVENNNNKELQQENNNHSVVRESAAKRLLFNNNKKKSSSSASIKQSVIQTAIQKILDKQQQQQSKTSEEEEQGLYATQHAGRILIQPSPTTTTTTHKFQDLLTVRVSSPPKDDLCIANLRLDVFANLDSYIQSQRESFLERQQLEQQRRQKYLQNLDPYGPPPLASSLDSTSISTTSTFMDSGRYKQNLEEKFRQRSCEVMNIRRQKGAVCLVASVPKIYRGDVLAHVRNKELGNHNLLMSKPLSTTRINNNHFEDEEWIVGSVECSIHEFYGTSLGKKYSQFSPTQQKQSPNLLYITEVAVSPKARRIGIGSALLQGIDAYASSLDFSEIYLHVDVTNDAALKLYQNAGYQVLNKFDKMYMEFTTSLNLQDGKTNGRNHYLLKKKVL
eukprot:CAMPEP_0178959742 /NCGR_PEP_ID=MMETSP0789-20121207/12490_1 /TAXON_ID=3005 /ORGANISM="Rhizosolenia setigera, Strain CCMP 1694" /LENGTH=405 /DNA_ID=CAMNT_0020642839 /DNA_START=421 /DNA_END=1638 /DNA_ORIENTATION=-